MANATLLATMGKPTFDGHGAGDGHGGFCGANKKQGGGTCGRPAGWGTGHLGVGACKQHGGSTPTHELSGALALARVEAVAMGNPLDIDPHEAILQCIRIAAGEVRYASDRIADLSVDDAVGPVTTTVQREASGSVMAVSYDQTTKGAPALHIWIETRHRAMDRLTSYAKVALAAGVEERRVRVAERAGEMMATLIRGVLTDLGVSLTDVKTREVVTRHLTLIEGGQAA